MLTTSGTYPWSIVTQMFCNGLPSLSTGACYDFFPLEYSKQNTREKSKMSTLKQYFTEFAIS